MKEAKYYSILLMLLALLFVVAQGCEQQTGGTTGTLALLISDDETQIESFDSVLVALDKVRVFKASGNNVTNETSETTYTDLQIDTTIDLTELVGENSIEVLSLGLEEGRYSHLELYVSSVEATMNGETVNVTVPSNKLRLIKPFTITAGQETEFVFDIEVVQRGTTGEYNLRPVIAKSGTVGEDIEEESVQRLDCTVDDDCPGALQCTEGRCAAQVTGMFALLISDDENQIENFSSLQVSLDKVRVFMSGVGDEEDEDENETEDEDNETEENETEENETEENETEDENENSGFTEIDVDMTLELTELQGEKSIEVLNIELAEGRYTHLELYVASVSAMMNNESVNVTVPSGKLKLIKPFVIEAGENTTFVFDIEVVKRGSTGEYNLKPVIGKSGTVGKDIEQGQVNKLECTLDEDCNGNKICVGGRCEPVRGIDEEENETEETETGMNVTFNITASQWSFTPDTITVNKNDRVTLIITSTDVAHGFAIPQFNVNERLEPGQTTTVEFAADRKGTFTFFCSVQCGSGHSGMRGTLIVE